VRRTAKTYAALRKLQSGYTTDTYRSMTRLGAVGGLAIAIFAFVAEGIGIANGRIG
jgi:hypothetical protein